MKRLFQKATNSLKKRAFLVLTAVLILALAGICVWYFATFLPQQQAHQVAVEALQAYYNDKVALFKKG